MISITFNFTDVAQAAALFTKLTSNELASATVLAPAAAPATVDVIAAREVAAAAPKPAKPAKPAPAAQTAPSQPTAEAAPSQEPAAPVQTTQQPAAKSFTAAPAAAPSAPEIAYQDLYKAVLQLHKLDPTAAVPIAKGLGADTFKLLKPEQWAEAYKLVTKAIAARG